MSKFLEVIKQLTNPQYNRDVMFRDLADDLEERYAPDPVEQQAAATGAPLGPTYAERDQAVIDSYAKVAGASGRGSEQGLANIVQAVQAARDPNQDPALFQGGAQPEPQPQTEIPARVQQMIEDFRSGNATLQNIASERLGGELYPERAKPRGNNHYTKTIWENGVPQVYRYTDGPNGEPIARTYLGQGTEGGTKVTVKNVHPNNIYDANLAHAQNLQDLGTDLMGMEATLDQVISDPTYFENFQDSGVIGAAFQMWRSATGKGTTEDELRKKFINLKNKGLVEALPDGPQSDRDIAIFSKGFPDNKAGRDQVISYLRGAVKAAYVDQRVEEWRLRANNLLANGDQASIEEWNRQRKQVMAEAWEEAKAKYGSSGPINNTQSGGSQRPDPAAGNTPPVTGRPWSEIGG